MNRTIRNITMGAAIGMAALSAPVAAQADSIYPPSGSCTVSPASAAPGGTLSLSCRAATFSSNESVTITVTGENGAGASVGFVKFAVTTASGVVESATDGSLPATAITLPKDASGTYNIAAISATSAGGTATASVASTDGSGLPATGLDSNSLLGLWAGGGALVLAGIALAVGAVVRRHRLTQD
ncbi:LPXTG cell wall anchor domain-containing protein [Microbacterium sp. P02]|uniref:LPXTG cell wall anchor domain-containing protein n=1 Tax=unclassified Microbacterium TaxID=2609290 RepID=UPI00366C63AB